MAGKKLKIQKSQRTLSRINTKISTAYYIQIRQPKIKKQDRKEPKQENYLIYKGINIRITFRLIFRNHAAKKE